jgi:hypothetical protein
LTSKDMSMKRVPVDYCVPRIASPGGNFIAVTCAESPWGVVQGDLQTDAGVLALGAGTSTAYIRSNDTSIVRFQGLTGSTVSLGTNLQTYQFSLASSGALTQAQADARYIQQADTTLVRCASDDGGKLIVHALGLDWQVPTMPYMEAAYRTYSQNDNVYLSKSEAALTYSPVSSTVDTSQFVTTANLSTVCYSKAQADARFARLQTLQAHVATVNSELRSYVRTPFLDCWLYPQTSNDGQVLIKWHYADTDVNMATTVFARNGYDRNNPAYVDNYDYMRQANNSFKPNLGLTYYP